MDIRPGEMADRFRAVALLKEFHAESMADYPFDAARAEALYKAHLAPDRLALVACDMDGAQGLLLAAASDHPFGMGRVSAETIWFVRSAARGRGALRMLDAYEDWARGQGCRLAGMTARAAHDVGSLYMRRGYRPAETHWLKAL